MRQTISSAQTFVMKVIVPTLTIGAFGTTALFLFLAPDRLRDQAGNPAPPFTKWAILVAAVIGSALLYWICVRLKRVALDRRHLYVSNYLKEIKVPLPDVDAITENRWVNIHPVTIHFTRDTAFGRSIVFMPTVRWFAFFSPHPIVEELQKAVDRARRTQDDHGS